MRLRSPDTELANDISQLRSEVTQLWHRATNLVEAGEADSTLSVNEARLVESLAKAAERLGAALRSARSLCRTNAAARKAASNATV